MNQSSKDFLKLAFNSQDYSKTHSSFLLSGFINKPIIRKRVEILGEKYEYFKRPLPPLVNIDIYIKEINIYSPSGNNITGSYNSINKPYSSDQILLIKLEILADDELLNNYHNKLFDVILLKYYNMFRKMKKDSTFNNPIVGYRIINPTKISFINTSIIEI